MIMMVMVLNKKPKPGRAPPIASWQERRHDDDALMTPTLSLSTPKWDQIWMKIEGIAQNIEKKAQQTNRVHCTLISRFEISIVRDYLSSTNIY